MAVLVKISRVLVFYLIFIFFNPTLLASLANPLCSH